MELEAEWESEMGFKVGFEGVTAEEDGARDDEVLLGAAGRGTTSCPFLPVVGSSSPFSSSHVACPSEAIVGRGRLFRNRLKRDEDEGIMDRALPRQRILPFDGREERAVETSAPVAESDRSCSG